MDKAHHIQHVSFSGTVIHLRVDGKDYQIPYFLGSPSIIAPFAAESVLAIEKIALFPHIPIYDTIDKQEERENEENLQG